MTCQAPLSVGLSRQRYWSGLPFPPPGLYLWWTLYDNSNGQGQRGTEPSHSVKRYRDYIFLILEIKETFLATRAQKGSLKVKRGHHPIVGDANLPIGLFTRLRLGLRDVHTQGGL